MEEQQALLGRSTVRPSLFPPQAGDGLASPDYPEDVYDEGAGSSSDGSDSWWEDSHSSCSSCTESTEEEWEDEISPEGELLYIEASPFTSQSAPLEKKEDVATEPTVEGVLPANNKPGKFVRWIRRRESKRQRPRLSVVGEQKEQKTATDRLNAGGIELVTIEVKRNSGEKADSSLLGFESGVGEGGSVIVKNISQNGYLAGCEKISVGDCLKTVNGEEVSILNLEKCLSGLPMSSKVTLAFLKRKEATGLKEKPQSKLVQRVQQGDPMISAKLSKVPAAVLVIKTGEQSDEGPDSDLLYCFPPQSCLAPGRGAFVTLDHLLPSFVGSEIRSCTCAVKGQDVNVAFVKEDDLLVLLALPEKVFRVEEVTWMATDMVRCLQFSHQTLHLILSVGSSGILDVPLDAMDSLNHHFHEFLSSAPWVPLPREAQLQLDDALNELEACDFGHAGDEAQESERVYIILGSCLYHQGCLLVSHLTKEDLIDVQSFLRENGLTELMKEGVARMVLWREIYPSSVLRGLPPTTPTAYPPPVGRWFLLIVASGHDMLCVLLENAGCCLPLPQPARPHNPHILEAEDTLSHIQSLGLTGLAAQWLSSRARPRTTAQPLSTVRPSPRDKAWGALQRPIGTTKNLEAEKPEDSASQTTSNVSNASESDENAPILGRRAERSAHMHNVLKEMSDESHSESEDSDSDWGSFKGLSIHHDNGSGLFDNPYMRSNVDDLDDITPTKITAGPDNHLFHFVYVDGNEGVVVVPGGDAPPSSSLITLFTRAAHNIHAQLQHNVRFRAAADPRGVANKSLVAVKECAILLDAPGCTTPHWVAGRLFFTPKPREVYVCYRDGAPQNMLELAFRLCLGVAG